MLSQDAAGSSTALPNAPSASIVVAPTPPPPYVPLTKQEKFDRWVHFTYSPYTFASVLLNATYAQMVGDWPSYGGGMQGYGKRFGATLADTEIRGVFVTFLLPTMLHQDPRYFSSHKEGVFPRFWYAGTRVLVTPKDTGENTFNTSEVVGTLFTKAFTNSYYPQADRGFGRTMSGTLGALLSDAGSNELREFWPDIRRVFRRHEPERLKKLEQKMPKTLEKVALP